MNQKHDYIAVFDSGVGGISVLRHLLRVLPGERFLYFGDSTNAPYGSRTTEEVRQLTLAAAKKLTSEYGLKALVIACNTATGMAVDGLRQQYPDIPIIGVEPAVKPAAEQHPGGRVLVLATPLCLKGQRFHELHDRFRDQAEIIPVPCGGLMEFVEHGVLEGPVLRNYLKEKLAPWMEQRVDAAVLGCTHYPFLRNAIAEVLGAETDIIDGNAGITAQLQRRMTELGLRNPSETPGTVTFYNSLDNPEILELSKTLLELPD